MRRAFQKSSPNPSLSRKFHTAAGNDAKPANNDNLPRWNLNLLYPGLESKELLADKTEVETRGQQFAKDYETTIPYLNGAELADAIAEYESIEALRTKISAYIGLMESDSVNNFAKTDALKKWQSEAGGTVSFFESEIAEMKERDLMTKLGASPDLARYAPWIAGLRAGRSYLVDPEVDNMAAEYYNSNREAWRRLYHETYNAMRVEVDGKKLSIDAVHEMMGDDKATLEHRREWRGTIAEVL